MLNTRTLAGTAATLLLLTGCATAPADDDAPRVLAAFYPLQFVAEQVAGDLVSIDSVTPQGAEPHDLELAPAQVRAIGAADLLVYLGGFQPALDDAVAQRAPEVVIDATATLGLDSGLSEPADGDHAHDGDHGDEEHHDAHDHDHGDEELGDAAGDDHADDDHADHDPGHDHSGHDHDGDPHFWLDPALLADLAHPVADALATIDPDNASTYAANADRLAEGLAALDSELANGLAQCERDVVVVSHEAFGYLTERYGLTQLGLSGIDPEGEPSPARLREIRAVIADTDVTTIFTETLVNPKAAEVLASDLGLATALLDPLEAQVDTAADYRDVMRANLEALRLALGCA